MLLVSGLAGTGVAALLAALDRRDPSAAARDAAATLRTRHARAEAQLSGILAERLRERLRDPAHRAVSEAAVAAVAAHAEDPYSAADRLLGTLFGTEG